MKPTRTGILLLAALAATAACPAENRFFFSAETVLSESTANTLEVLCDNDEVALGFSFAIRYNPVALEVTALTNEGTEAAEADYFSGLVDQETGQIGFGCVYDTGGIFDEKHLAAGTEQRIGVITFNSLLAEASEETLQFQDISFPPNIRVPVRNILTDGNGSSIVPALENGRITILSGTPEKAPQIIEITGGRGEAGQVFHIFGFNFYRPFDDLGNFSITVCGNDATAPPTTLSSTLSGSNNRNQTIRVRSTQAFPSSGFVKIDEEVIGYSGKTANTFTGLSRAVEGPRRSHSINTEVYPMINRGDPCGLQEITITAPACKAGGCVAVVVTTARGSAEVSDGFCYVRPEPGESFLRGDADSDLSVELTDAILVLNYLFLAGRAPTCMDSADIDDNSSIELSDAIYVLNYLFLGGRLLPAPFPDCGEDSSADELDCESYPDCP